MVILKSSLFQTGESGAPLNERRNITVAAFETVNLRRDNKSNSSFLR